jgi:hypothetical protein
MFNKVFGPNYHQVGNLGYYIMKNFISYTGHLVMLGYWHRGRYAGPGMPQMEEKRNTHKILVGSPRGKESFRTTTRRWDSSIKMHAMQTVCKDGKWMELSQNPYCHYFSGLRLSFDTLKNWTRHFGNWISSHPQVRCAYSVGSYTVNPKCSDWA